MRWILSILTLACLAWSSFPKVENNTFEEGEYALYRMHYGLLTGGYASVRVSDTLYQVDNKTCFHLEAKGWTTSSFDLFYKVTVVQYRKKSSRRSLRTVRILRRCDSWASARRPLRSDDGGPLHSDDGAPWR